MRFYSRRLLPVFLTVGFSSLLLAGGAGAATLNVSTAGADSPTCGPVLPCATLAQAVTNSGTNDTIAIGAGTFAISNITVGAKSLAIGGAGIGVTILDGGNATNSAAGGGLRFNGGGTTSSVSNLTMQNLARPNAAAATAAIGILAQPATAGQAVNLTVTSVQLIGTPPATTPTVTAIDSANNSGTLGISNVLTTALNGQSVLLERHIGPATVSNSQFNAANTNFVTYDYSWGGAPWTVTGAHQYTNNVINGPAGIFVNAGFAFAPLAESSYTGGVTIANNVISSSVPSVVGVRISNTPIGAAASTATISGVSVTGNSITGNSAAGSGVLTEGAVATTSIQQNNIRGFANGVNLTNSPKFASDGAQGTIIQRNQLVDNGGATKIGLRTDSSAANIQAGNNWWGCNAGPPVGASATAADCDSIVNLPASTASLPSWIVLGIDAAPATLGESDAATVNASLALNNLGSIVAGVFADGSLVAMSAAGGTVASAIVPTTAAIATTTFQSNGLTGRSASATKDHQTVSFGWPDGSVEPPPSPPAPPPTPEPLPDCVRDLLISNVTAHGSTSVIAGIARLKFVGQRVAIRYQPTGSHIVARPVVQPNGSFSVRVRRPRSPAANSNNARYQAAIGGTKTSWIKLSRRLITQTISSSGGRLKVSGRVVDGVGGSRVYVNRSDACGQYRVIGSVRLNRDGRFNGTIPVTVNPAVPVALIRLRALSRSSSNPNRSFSTYSIVRPVPLGE